MSEAYRWYGQSALRQRLLSLVRQGRLSHAVLLTGDNGLGKRTLARWLAALLTCAAPPDKAPCDACNSCHKVRTGIHPDVLEMSGTGAARSFHVGKVRELQKHLTQKPNDGDRRVLLLFGLEDMTAQAQNALLKSLEEPPPGVFFIATARDPSVLLPTVRSRVTVYALAPVPQAEVEAFLRQLGAAEEHIAVWAAASGGNLGRARELAESGAVGVTSDRAGQLLKAMLIGQEVEVLAALAPVRTRQALQELLLACIEPVGQWIKETVSGMEALSLEGMLLSGISLSRLIRTAEALDTALGNLERNASVALTGAGLTASLFDTR